MSRPTRFFLLASMVAVFALLIFWAGWDSSSDSHQLEDAAGLPVTLELSGADVTIVHFWATWCGPCRDELPALDAFLRRPEARAVRFYAVSQDTSRNEIDTYLKANRLRMTSLLDSGGATAGRFGLNVLPTTLLINRNGELLRKIEGPVQWSDHVEVDRLLREVR